ncbi:hypothetical protein [Streptomyces sp. NPDC048338]
MVWPDAEGRFLREAAAAESYGRSQPRLWLTPAERPEGVRAAVVTG